MTRDGCRRGRLSYRGTPPGPRASRHRAAPVAVIAVRREWGRLQRRRRTPETEQAAPRFAEGRAHQVAEGTDGGIGDRVANLPTIAAPADDGGEPREELYKKRTTGQLGSFFSPSQAAGSGSPSTLAVVIRRRRAAGPITD